ncbi:RMD1 family protein [Methylomonas sp. MED-D]|uniref:RMD1 family protein n=1 Tax=unclassified Methylomonas TaxID=2608980 RepID=UPI00143A6C24|nr:RMD1 family protein [Methylomonas sp. UP202]NJA05868.1 RMD1 family protein [Methylococcaceae bacterium WWC4]WGS86378.1 RMD1 family protein [Methylomonas sp. UP202]
MENRIVKRCMTVCLAQSFRFADLREKLLDTRRTQVFRNALIVDYKTGCAVVFSYGVVVYWNVALDERHGLQELLLEYATTPADEPPEDNFSYETDCEQDRFQHDHIELQSGDFLVLLALSHAMAQSIKLAAFEGHAIDTIRATAHLPRSLAREGKIKLNRQAMAMIRGQLFLTKSDIILNYDLLDTPEFFWEHPEYQSMYSMAANYLEIAPRTEVLSKKLETIHELLEMLADEQKHQHSSALEWIIIWLIAVEIVMSIVDRLL